MPLSIDVDRREDLRLLLERAGMAVTTRELLSADYRWEGQGPKGSCLIGLERKKLRDFITSDNYGRLVAQGIKMSQEHTYSYLLLEAIIRPQSGTGYLESYDYRSKRFQVVYVRGLSVHWRTLMGKLFTLSEQFPFRFIRTAGSEQTVWMLEALVHWWSKPWEKHSTHHKFWSPPPPIVGLTKPPLLDRMGKELPGVAWEKARLLRHYFGSPVAMAVANEAAWSRIPGIGKTLSKRIVKALRNQKEE